ncbi:MAG: DUF2240 family protein [Candidatus Methanomethylophilaceae archaeon]|jgi:hypothetical protein
MVEDMTVCAAAFFRSKGRDVIAEKEFTMGVSLDLRWMTVKEAGALVNAMKSAGILELKDGYLRPKFDISEVDVPMAYRPSPDFVKRIAGTPADSKPVETPQSEDNVFAEMMAIAEKSGMRRAGYIAACNLMQKKLDVDIEVAGMMVLRTIGADVSGLYGRVRETVIGK